MEIDAIKQFSALSHPQRLALFRLLVRRCPDEVPAGEIARILSLKPNTASVYLAALHEAGLVVQRRHGTSLLYSANLQNAEALTDYLFRDCCRSRPALCEMPATNDGAGDWQPPEGTYNVLFVCTGNSARSIFAEALMRDEAGDRFNVYSAGSHPFAAPNPMAVHLLQKNGLDISHLRSKHLAEFQGSSAPRLDFVFTVCDLAANEECPPWKSQPISAHWGLVDPVKVTGTYAEKQNAFAQTFRAMAQRIKAFAALPFAELDRATLQSKVDEIGRLPETT